MKLICTHCGTVLDKGTRLCTNIERKCPPGGLSILFGPGEHINDVEVLSEPYILRTSALYRAKQGREAVWLKVAHKDYHDRLKMEVSLLAGNDLHPAYFKLRSVAIGEQRPYGKFTTQGEVKYYALYEYVEGRFLREILDQKQMYLPQRAVWLVIGLADMIAFLHIRLGKLLLNLSPDTIYVRMDKEGIPRPMLADFSLASRPEEVRPAWFEAVWKAAYLAPEQVNGRGCEARTDVYALGLIQYELLTGEPPFSALSSVEVRALVNKTKPLLRQRRPELAQGISDLADQALEKDPARRPPDVRTFAKGLRMLVGEVPPEKRGRQIDIRLIAVAAFVVMVILIGFTLWLLTRS
jgi:serine/threonine protein kinase